MRNVTGFTSAAALLTKDVERKARLSPTSKLWNCPGMTYRTRGHLKATGAGVNHVLPTRDHARVEAPKLKQEAAVGKSLKAMLATRHFLCPKGALQEITEAAILCVPAFSKIPEHRKVQTTAWKGSLRPSSRRDVS